MPRKKKRIQVRFMSSPLYTRIISISLGLILFYLFYLIHSQTKPVIETLRSEQRNVPSEVRKQAARITPTMHLTVPILIYHYVEYVTDERDTIRQSLNINPNIFESQIKTLKDAGYHFMTAAELADVLDGKRFLPPKPVLITIDDGHYDVATDILPILQKYHVKATAYLVSGFIDKLDFLTSDEVRSLIKSGLVEIGAHTMHHVSLKDKLLNTVQTELVDSKKTMHDVFHISVVSFAYPNGEYDLQAVQEARRAGYRTAVSTVPGVEVTEVNRYFLPRLHPGRLTGQDFLKWIEHQTSK